MIDISYDNQVKAMYISLKKRAGQRATTNLGQANVYMDTDVNGKIVGFELLLKEPLNVNEDTHTILNI